MMNKSLACAVAALAICFFASVVHSMPGHNAKSFLQPNSERNTQRLRHLGKHDLAEELSGQYQGDIVVTPEQLKRYKGATHKTGLIDTDFRWQDKTVPYWIDESYFNESQIEYIHMGAKRLEEETCLKFVRYDASKHSDYITIEGGGSGCWSYVGRIGGQQFMNLQPFEREIGCFRLYTIAHEFLHALGFFHMQSATERDEYVNIVWDKIQDGTEGNFDAYGTDFITNYDVEYDYGSVMHYGKTAFSVDGSDTIIPLKDLKGETMGQRVRLSPSDIDRVNRMYCSEATTTVQPQPPPVSLPELIFSIKTLLRQMLRNIFGLLA